MEAPGFRVDEKNSVVVVNLVRPEKLNSLSTRLLEGLEATVRRLAENPRVLLLNAVGRVFSAGIDLSEVAAATTPDEVAQPFKALGRAIKALLDYPAPTISYVDGPAIAGGAELALATDIILVTKSATFEWPEVKWNIVPPLLLSLATTTGIPRLAAAALTGSRITAQEALSLGLAAAIVEGGYPGALKIAEQTAKLYRENRDAYQAMLPLLRSWKRRAVEETLPSLESLATSMELKRRAEEFLSRRRR